MGDKHFMWNGLYVFLGNPASRAAIFGWAIAQVLKVVIDLFRQRKFHFERFVGSGGMPSSHSSFVVAMTVAIARHDGIASTYFAIAVVLSMIVMYDAMGVRRAAGNQARLINWMADNWHDEDEDEATDTEQLFDKKLKELIGHTPVEVIAGAILGITIGFLV